MGQLVKGSSKEGKQMRDKFLSGFPKLSSLIDNLSEEWEENKAKYKDGWISGLDNRRVFVDSPHKLLNYKLQGDEAVYMKYALVISDKLIKKNSIDADLLVFYHDEFDSSVSPSNSKKLQKVYKHSFIRAGEYLDIKCKMETDPKEGNNWYEIH